MRFAVTSAAVLAVAIAAALPVAAAKDTPAAQPAAAKTADAPAAEAPKTAAKPVVEPAERAIEKRNGDFIYKVTFRPGNLKPNRVADFRVQLYRALESPDPVNGDREPLAGSQPMAAVQPPSPAAQGKGHKAIEPPPSVRYTLWPEGDPGNFVFHFTPTEDGLYQLTLSGTAKASDDGEAAPFSATFRLGVGTAAADTELSQGETPRRARDAEEEDDGLTQIQRSMRQIGQRYLDLEDAVNHPSKGSKGDAAAEARAIADLFAQVKGQVPSDRAADTGEFDTLADAARERLDGIGNAVDGHDASAARAGVAKLELQSCDQCHAKYWYGVTDDLSTWPAFHPKAAKAAAE